MEVAVGNPRPLIPIRVADDLPTYAEPLQAYLPDIVAAVKNIATRQRNPWANITRRMPRSRSTP
ncbi:MAG TPA: hypothetical protein VIY90_16935 [Steroidobacteraceae bacterium]